MNNVRKNHKNIKNFSSNTGKGVLAFTFDKNTIQSHQNTFRVLLIGPSNCGKSTSIPNILIDFPRPIKSITYIAPPNSHYDETPLKMKKICEKANIKYNSILVHDMKSKIEIPNSEKPEVIIFDDLYKYKNIEPFVDNVFTQGRHNKQNVIYISQSPAFIPSSARVNFTHLMLNKAFFNEDTEKKFHFPKNTLTQFLNEANDPEKQFLIIKTGGIVHGWYVPPKFCSAENVIKTFKSMSKGVSKGYFQIPEQEEKIIKKGIENAGNENVDQKTPIYKPYISDMFKNF